LLAVENLEVVYEDVILVLKGVSLRVPEGEIVALLGANGAGKTTVLRAITGLLDIHRGSITKGSVRLDDEPIHHLDAPGTVAKGIGQVMEGRRIFAEFTVEENLRIGAHTASRSLASRAMARNGPARKGTAKNGGGGSKVDLDRVYTLFPLLADRRRQIAGYLSGGEQQMLALGRALMSEPKYLLLDEPSLGLAPRMVQQIRELIVEINRQGTAILLVEQNAAMALDTASHGYVLETGKVVMDKPSAQLREDDDIREFYLGIARDGHTSFHDVKHYKRRKRWLS
jgi:branched-chain amino acid transport system ATP-binding protein